MRFEALSPRAIGVLMVLVFHSALCFSQSRTAVYGSLEVVVKDPSGALVNKALVQLLSNGKLQSSAQTNQKGEARFNRIAPGHYQIHVEAAGFKSQDIEVAEISPGTNRTELAMEIEIITVDVEVADEAQVRNTDPNGSAFSNVLNAEQIAQLSDDPAGIDNAINPLARTGAHTRVNGFS